MRKQASESTIAASSHQTRTHWPLALQAREGQRADRPASHVEVGCALGCREGKPDPPQIAL